MGQQGVGKAAVRTALLVALGVGIGCDGSGRAEGASPEEAPAEAVVVVDSLFAAMNAGDADRVLSFYVETPELVTVQCTAMRLGYESLARIVRMYYGGGPRATLEHEVVRSVSLGEDAALVASTARDTAGTELFQTYVLQRVAGDWRIAAEHESWAECAAARRHPTVEGGPDAGSATP